MFALASQPMTPVIVKIVQEPAKEISVADILLGSVGITALFLIGAALLGFLLGGLFIWFRHRQIVREAVGIEGNPYRLNLPTEPPSEHS
jgi:hypothetical protein